MYSCNSFLLSPVKFYWSFQLIGEYIYKKKNHFSTMTTCQCLLVYHCFQKLQLLGSGWISRLDYFLNILSDIILTIRAHYLEYEVPFVGIETQDLGSPTMIIIPRQNLFVYHNPTKLSCQDKYFHIPTLLTSNLVPAASTYNDMSVFGV